MGKPVSTRGGGQGTYRRPFLCTRLLLLQLRLHIKQARPKRTQQVTLLFRQNSRGLLLDVFNVAQDGLMHVPDLLHLLLRIQCLCAIGL